MKIYIQILIAIFIVANLLSGSYSFFNKPNSFTGKVKEVSSPGGFWKTKTQWKAYWVKDWVSKTIYVPVWKHVWGPAEIKEWVPTGVAKPPPPGWRPPVTTP